MASRECALVVVLVTSASLSAFGADKKVQLKDLPPPVQKVVQDQTKGATLLGLSVEREGGRVLYEIETTVNGRTRDLLVDGSGALVEVEEQVTLDAVPPAVKAALVAAGHVRKVEAVTKGFTVTYEAKVEVNGKTSEVVLDATGHVHPPR